MRKDPTLACLLNLILVGAGHIYLGLLGKGIFIMVLGIVLGLLTYGIGTLLVIIWAMFDAYNIAQKMNRPAKKTAAEKG
ncbi:MAG: hypothetical protein ACYSTL_00140 [Planctomycetota bacterium]|jgi:TM2 domain-containing membrane protein YozV